MNHADPTVQVTNLSSQGIWILAHDKEMFLPYDEFPWFKGQPVRMILNVEELLPGHFCWPELDVDLSEEIIEHPARFPNRAGGKT